MVRIIGLLLTNLILVNSQALWDYNDYNSFLFPTSFAQPNFNNPHIPPHMQQRQVQPPQPGSFNWRPPPPIPHPRMPPPMIPTHRLGSPSYRPPASEQRFGEREVRFGPSNGPYYTGKGNDFIGSSAEHAALSHESSNHGDLDSLLAKIVTKLPSIADQFSHMLTTTPQTPNLNPDFWLPFVQPDAADAKSSHILSESVRQSPAKVINSMPDPSAFFSFGKLLNAFTGSGLDGPKFDKQVDQDKPEEHTIDVESVKGVPILKDEDSEPETIRKNDNEEELPAAHSLETSSPDESTSTPELIIFTLPTNIEEETTTPEPPKTTTEKDEGDNLLGSLLNGKLDRVDWLGSIFGGNKKDSSKKEEESGNALAQLFSGTGLFGSAVQQDDDNQKLRKYEDRNFH